MFAFAIIYFSVKNYRLSIWGSMSSEQEMNRIEQRMIFDEELEIDLLYGQYEIPYEMNRGCYIFPAASDFSCYDTNIHLLNENQSILWAEDEYWANLDEAIENNHVFEFYIIEDGRYNVGKLLFTGLPLMVLETNDTENGIVNCEMTLFDPKNSSKDNYHIVSSDAFYEIRGNTSVRFPKVSYNLNLFTKDLAKNDLSLLGLRSDDDWKLNAFYTDRSRVREAVAIAMWDELAQNTESPYDTGTKMEYMELIIDEEYIGIYGLMEQIDFKQLNLDKNKDVLYKGRHFINDENSAFGDFNERYEYCGQTIKTGNQSVSEELWMPMIEYVEQMYYFDVKYMEGNESEIWEYTKDHFNIDNFLNYDLYIQAICGVDNAYKNQYIAAVLDDRGDYQLWKCPWDLNYSFGDFFEFENENLTKYSIDDYTKIMNKHMLTEQLLNANIEEFVPILQNHWETLRKTTLSIEHVQYLTELYSNQLHESGAFLRELDAWPFSAEDGSEYEITEFYSKRMEYLDSHYLNHGYLDM